MLGSKHTSAHAAIHHSGLSAVALLATQAAVQRTSRALARNSPSLPMSLVAPPSPDGDSVSSSSSSSPLSGVMGREHSTPRSEGSQASLVTDTSVRLPVPVRPPAPVSLSVNAPAAQAQDAIDAPTPIVAPSPSHSSSVSGGPTQSSHGPGAPIGQVASAGVPGGVGSVTPIMSVPKTVSAPASPKKRLLHVPLVSPDNVLSPSSLSPDRVIVSTMEEMEPRQPVHPATTSTRGPRSRLSIGGAPRAVDEAVRTEITVGQGGGKGRAGGELLAGMPRLLQASKSQFGAVGAASPQAKASHKARAVQEGPRIPTRLSTQPTHTTAQPTLLQYGKRAPERSQAPPTGASIGGVRLLDFRPPLESKEEEDAAAVVIVGDSASPANAVPKATRDAGVGTDPQPPSPRIIYARAHTQRVYEAPAPAPPPAPVRARVIQEEEEEEVAAPSQSGFALPAHVSVKVPAAAVSTGVPTPRSTQPQPGRRDDTPGKRLVSVSTLPSNFLESVADAGRVSGSAPRGGGEVGQPQEEFWAERPPLPTRRPPTALQGS